MSYFHYRKKPEDRDLIFSIIMLFISIVLILILGVLLPRLPWEKIGILFLCGIYGTGVTVYVILTFFKKFQKEMIALQLVSGIFLFAVYFLAVSALIMFDIVRLPRNIWAYIAIFLIFGPLILFPALHLEYKYIIKTHLKKRKKKAKLKEKIKQKEKQLAEEGSAEEESDETEEEKKKPLDPKSIKTYLISMFIFILIFVIGCPSCFGNTFDKTVTIVIGGMIGFVAGFLINLFSGR